MKWLQRNGPVDPSVPVFLKRFIARRTHRRRISKADALTIIPDRLIAPHSLLFSLYTALYFIPLWLVESTGYGEGLIAQTGADAKTLMSRIVVVYAAGLLSFLLGSWSTSKLAWLLGERARPRNAIARIPVYSVDKFCLVVLIFAFIISKILLIPSGAYSHYAFDAGIMETQVWTSSMFFSETLAFASLIALFSNLRHNVLAFAALSFLNGVNLLHGTRNFFVTAMTGMMLYAYTRKKVSFPKLFLYGVSGFGIAVSLAYVVYLRRQHADFSDFSVLSLLSPITFESVFSQLSLINLLGHRAMFENFGNAQHLVQDVFIFTMPRILVGHKEALLWTDQFGNLSPLGAFNGFAMGLLYFGYSLPIAYFVLGLCAGLLRRLANTGYGAALYVTFCCDFLYRLQRDGYVIPAKMLINNLGILCILACLHLWIRRNKLKIRSGNLVTATGTHPKGASRE